MSDNSDITRILLEISTFCCKLPDSPQNYSALSLPQRRKLRADLEATLKKLELVQQHLDPVAQPNLVFDPTAPKIVAKLVAETLLLQPRCPLKDMADARFYGAGVYAIYYTGDFDAYRPVSGKEYPLYIGKADPAEIHANTPQEQGERLSSRLRDHARSIRGTTNLKLQDFECRYLVVRTAWVETAEDHLIEHFKPVWNREIKVCYGFGKHGDDPDTRGNKRSPWDTLHPGRSWATRDGNAPGAKTVLEIKQSILAHFRACNLS